jgi:hypothetical protein
LNLRFFLFVFSSFFSSLIAFYTSSALFFSLSILAMKPHLSILFFGSPSSHPQTAIRSTYLEELKMRGLCLGINLTGWPNSSSGMSSSSCILVYL